MEVTWNPWHGCTKYSEGCRNCYVYRQDEMFGRDSTYARKQMILIYLLRRIEEAIIRFLAVH